MIIIRLTRNIDNVASVFAEKKKKTCRKTDLTKSEISRSSLARESILYIKRKIGQIHCLLDYWNFETEIFPNIWRALTIFRIGLKFRNQ